MSKYVEVDAIREKLKEYIGLTNGFDRAFAEVSTVDIILCKDCEAYIGGECECDSLYAHMSGDLIGVTLYPNENFYCGYGIRRQK